MFEFRPVNCVLDVVVDPVAVDLAEATAFGVVDRAPIDGEADRLAHPLVMERAFRVLEAGEFEPPIARQNRRQHHFRIVLDAADQLAGNEIGDVGLAAFDHRNPGRGFRDADHRQVLDVHRSVVAVEGLHFEPGAGFL